MHPPRRIPKSIIVLFSVLFITLFVLFALRVQANTPEIPDNPTPTPDTSFVLDLPQKAMFRNYVVVSAEAVPGTSCELTYISPSGESQQMDTTANKDGQCEWRWKIEESQGKGSGRLIFTIDGKSETHFFEILSSF